jgi:hypothetical protein
MPTYWRFYNFHRTTVGVASARLSSVDTVHVLNRLAGTTITHGAARRVRVLMLCGEDAVNFDDACMEALVRLLARFRNIVSVNLGESKPQLTAEGWGLFVDALPHTGLVAAWVDNQKGCPDDVKQAVVGALNFNRERDRIKHREGTPPWAQGTPVMEEMRRSAKAGGAADQEDGWWGKPMTWPKRTTPKSAARGGKRKGAGAGGRGCNKKSR